VQKRDLLKQLREIAGAGDADLEFLSEEGGSHEMWTLPASDS
jgi:hypothetical protein